MSLQLSTLLSTPYAPGFVYLHHPHTPSASAIPPPPAGGAHAQISAIEYNTARLLYTALLYRLAEASGGVWAAGEVRTWDGFARGLRTLWRDRAGRASGSGSGERGDGGRAKLSRKGKEKEVLPVPAPEVLEGGAQEGNWVVVITHAERLPRILGAQWAVLTRISELADIPITLLLASQTPWDTLRPPASDAPEPVHIYLPSPTRPEIQLALLSASSHPLWPHFLNLFLATFYPLVHGLQELAYLAGPLWEIYTAALPPHAESALLMATHKSSGEREGTEGEGEEDGPSHLPPKAPKLEITVKLLTDLKYALSLPLTLAIEHLLPRRISPREFVHFLRPSPAGTAPTDPRALLAARAKKGIPKLPGLDIPVVGRYLIVAGYLAGQNPAKSDLRLFGRGMGVDGKRKRGGGTRRAGYGKVKVGKVPQRLLGPKAFPLDRLLAIFSSLYSEHAERPPDLMPALNEGDDYDDSGNDSSSSSGDSSMDDEEQSSRRKRKKMGANGGAVGDSMVDRQRKRVERKRRRDIVREERWEEEVEAICMSAKLWSLIPELESQGLFRRISPLDRLDNVMLRCEVDYEAAKVMAREMKVTLDEYLYEAQA